MGLSGRKSKQRIGHDPRNLAWANDANKFGAAYLEKFGWASGSGLGATGEGRTKHISVYQKLDMLGIGADHRNSQDGTAWKQGKDFENLLRRLNAAGADGDEGATDVPKIDGFVKPTAVVEEDAESEEQKDKRKSKKRKRSEKEDGDDEVQSGEDEERRRKKKERKERKAREKEEKAERKANKGKKREGSSSKDKEKKRKHKSSDDEDAPSTPTEVVAVTKAPVSTPRPLRAHRARHIAMKGLASKSATAIAEILGVPSSSATPTQSDTLAPSASITAVDSPIPDVSAASAGLKMHDLTTSSKSVMDYFREKLAAKSTRSSEASTPTAVASPAADDYDERPRGGLGLGASRLRVEAAVEVDEYEERPRGGLGSSRLAMSMGMMSFVQSTSRTTVALGEDTEQPQGVDDGDADVKKSKKRKRREGRADEDGTVRDAEAVPTSVEEKSEKKKKKKHKADTPTDGDAAKEDGDKSSKKRRKKESKAVDSEVPSEEKSKRRKKKRDTDEAAS